MSSQNKKARGNVRVVSAGFDHVLLETAQNNTFFFKVLFFSLTFFTIWVPAKRSTASARQVAISDRQEGTVNCANFGEH